MTTAMLHRSDALTYGPVYPVWPATDRQVGVPLLTVMDEATDPWQRVIARLQSFADLTEDWDGEGSAAPPPLLVENAVALAGLLRREGMPPPSHVAAGPDGTVLLVWQGEQEGQPGVIYFEIEVCAPDAAEWMRVIPGQPVQHGEIEGWSLAVEPR